MPDPQPEQLDGVQSLEAQDPPAVTLAQSGGPAVDDRSGAVRSGAERSGAARRSAVQPGGSAPQRSAARRQRRGGVR